MYECTHIAHKCCDQLTAVKTVSADQYHLIVSRAQVSIHRGRVFFKVIRWQVTSFQMIGGSSYYFYFNSYERNCIYVSHY